MFYLVIIKYMYNIFNSCFTWLLQNICIIFIVHVLPGYYKMCMIFLIYVLPGYYKIYV